MAHAIQRETGRVLYFKYKGIRPSLMDASSPRKSRLCVRGTWHSWDWKIKRWRDKTSHKSSEVRSFARSNLFISCPDGINPQHCSMPQFCAQSCKKKRFSAAELEQWRTSVVWRASRAASFKFAAASLRTDGCGRSQHRGSLVSELCRWRF